MGSGLGGLGRFAISNLMAERFGESFPWGTLCVNVVGSFLIGFVATLTSPDGRVLMGPHARQFLMVGLFGGFTTFSSFSLQTLNHARAGQWLHAGGNAVGNLALCLVAVSIGHFVALWLNATKAA